MVNTRDLHLNCFRSQLCTGQAIVRQQFPGWTVSEETYALTCLLHDIGTTPENLRKTLLSFEFYGGMLALRLISEELRAPLEQGEAVAEAIIRHQDLGETGKITTLGQLIQLATIFGESRFENLLSYI
jgi:cyanamide hydratase